MIIFINLETEKTEPCFIRTHHQKIFDQIFFIFWRRHGESIRIAGARRMGTGGCPGFRREGYDSYLKHLNFSFVDMKRCEWKIKQSVKY